MKYKMIIGICILLFVALVSADFTPRENISGRGRYSVVNMTYSDSIYVCINNTCRVTWPLGGGDLTNYSLTNETDNFTKSLFLNLTSCDTLDTNAEGLLVCGTDADSAGAPDISAYKPLNATGNFTGNITFQEDIFLYGKIYATINSVWQNIISFIETIISDAELNATKLDASVVDSELNGTALELLSLGVQANYTQRIADNTTQENDINTLKSDLELNGSTLADLNVDAYDASNLAFLNATGQFSEEINFSKAIRVNETSCDSVDTDSDGTLICGADADTPPDISSYWEQNNTVFNNTYALNTSHTNVWTYFGSYVSSAGANLTYAKLDEDNIFSEDISFTKKLDYHNTSGIPTCTGTDKLTYDGTDLSCSSDVDTGGDVSAYAPLNGTGNFTGNVTFEKDIWVYNKLRVTINSVWQDLLAFIETIVTNAEANATLLDTTVSDLELNGSNFDNYALNDTLKQFAENTTQNIQQLINNTALNVSGFEANGLLYVNSTGVGIGTASPNQSLHVVGNAIIRSGGTSRIYMGGTPDDDFGIAYSNSYPNYGIFYKEATPDIVGLSPNGGGTSNPVLTATGGGNVGIGTTAPSHTLNVDGTSNFTGNMLVGSNITLDSNITFIQGGYAHDNGTTLVIGHG